MDVGLGRLSIDRRAGRRSWLSDGAGRKMSNVGGWMTGERYKYWTIWVQSC